jgi:uncharacterized protein (UPF0548 family)
MSLTRPADPQWRGPDGGFRRWERSAELGRGDEAWRWASREVLRWGIKTRSGFTVAPGDSVSVGDRVTAGDRPVIMAHPFGFAVREPVEVVEVVEAPDRVGYAYRTLPGHPVSGEEAFIVHRHGDAVILTVRSLTRASSRGGWRAAYPALLVAQRVARRRYFRALRVRAPR